MKKIICGLVALFAVSFSMLAAAVDPTPLTPIPITVLPIELKFDATKNIYTLATPPTTLTSASGGAHPFLISGNKVVCFTTPPPELSNKSSSAYFIDQGSGTPENFTCFDGNLPNFSWQ